MKLTTYKANFLSLSDIALTLPALMSKALKAVVNLYIQEAWFLQTVAPN